MKPPSPHTPQHHTTPSAQATQSDKAQRFQALHAAGSGFIIPNPWDPGSARLLASLGFQALATTSAGFAFSRGLPDGEVPRDWMMQHLAELYASTHLPISADLLNGFGPQPSDVARCIIDAAQQGVVGGSLARAALSALVRAATELRDQGTTGYNQSAMRGAELNTLFSAPDVV